MQRYKTYEQMTAYEREAIVRRAVSEAGCQQPVSPVYWSQIKAVELPDQFLVELRPVKAGDEYWDHLKNAWHTTRNDCPNLVRLVKVKK